MVSWCPVAEKTFSRRVRAETELRADFARTPPIYGLRRADELSATVHWFSRSHSRPRPGSPHSKKLTDPALRPRPGSPHSKKLNPLRSDFQWFSLRRSTESTRPSSLLGTLPNQTPFADSCAFRGPRLKRPRPGSPHSKKLNPLRSDFQWFSLRRSTESTRPSSLLGTLPNQTPFADSGVRRIFLWLKAQTPLPPPSPAHPDHADPPPPPPPTRSPGASGS
jgi:hypothetical protein